jgi:hypothetical protein
MVTNYFEKRENIRGQRPNQIRFSHLPLSPLLRGECEERLSLK